MLFVAHGTYHFYDLNESSCVRGGDGPVAFNAQRQSLGFLCWMVKCSFTLYLLISHGMKAGGSVYSFIHSFIKGKCSRRLRKAPPAPTASGCWSK